MILFRCYRLVLSVTVLLLLVLIPVIRAGQRQPALSYQTLSLGKPLPTGAGATALPTQGGCASPYVVQWGDTLSLIAVRFDTTWQTLATSNHIANADVIFAGQTICVRWGIAVDTAPTIAINGNWQYAFTAGEPCQSTIFQVGMIGAWTVPPGCYGNIYTPNPAEYANRPGYGWCNWWVEVLHPNYTNYDAINLPLHPEPRPNAIVHFSPGEQGASLVGHYAQVIAIASGGQWLLISEMNMSWRGGGFARVSYRYVQVTPNTQFFWT